MNVPQDIALVKIELKRLHDLMSAKDVEITRLKSALLECAGDLEDEILARYPEPVHPSQARRKQRDMETVRMARNLATSQNNP